MIQNLKERESASQEFIKIEVIYYHLARLVILTSNVVFPVYQEELYSHHNTLRVLIRK